MSGNIGLKNAFLVNLGTYVSNLGDDVCVKMVKTNSQSELGGRVVRFEQSSDAVHGFIGRTDREESENRRIRRVFLAAILDEHGVPCGEISGKTLAQLKQLASERLPASVVKALKLKDFDGTLTESPLSKRRITAVISAVREVRQRASAQFGAAIGAVLDCLGKPGEPDGRELAAALTRYNRSRDSYLSRLNLSGKTKDAILNLVKSRIEEAVSMQSNAKLRLAYQTLQGQSMTNIRSELPVRMLDPIMDLEGVIVVQAHRRLDSARQPGGNNAVRQENDVSPQSLAQMMDTSARAATMHENRSGVNGTQLLTPTELKNYGNRIRSHELTINTKPEFIFGDFKNFRNAPVNQQGFSLVNMFMLKEKNVNIRKSYSDFRTRIEDSFFPLMKGNYAGKDRPFYAAINTTNNPLGACSGYGGMVLVLKDEVKKEATYAYGDSFEEAKVHFGYDDGGNAHELSAKTDDLLNELLANSEALEEATVSAVREALQQDNDIRKAVRKLLSTPGDQTVDEMFNANENYKALSRLVGLKDVNKDSYLLRSCIFNVCKDVSKTEAAPVDFDHVEELSLGQSLDDLATIKYLSGVGGEPGTRFAHTRNYIEAQVHKPLDIYRDVAEIRLSENELPDGEDGQAARSELLEWGREHGIKITFVNSASDEIIDRIMDLDQQEAVRKNSKEFKQAQCEIVSREYLQRHSDDERIKSIIRQTVNRESARNQIFSSCKVLTDALDKAIQDENALRQDLLAKYDQPVRAAILSAVKNSGADVESFCALLEKADGAIDGLLTGSVSRYKSVGQFADFVRQVSSLPQTGASQGTGLLAQVFNAIVIRLNGRAENEPGFKDAIRDLASRPGYKQLRLAVKAFLPVLGGNANVGEVGAVNGFQSLFACIDRLTGAVENDENGGAPIIPPGQVTDQQRAIFKELFPRVYKDRIANKYPLAKRELNSMSLSSYPNQAPRGVQQTRRFLLRCLRSYGQHESDFDRGDYHGRSHAVRVFIFANVLANIIRGKGGVVNRDVVAMMGAGHDIGRKGNGADVFEDLSAEKTKTEIKELFGGDDPDSLNELGDKIGNGIMSGDLGSEDVESYLLHSADSLDYWRVDDLNLKYFPFLREDLVIDGTTIHADKDLRQKLAEESKLLMQLTHPAGNHQLKFRQLKRNVKATFEDFLNLNNQGSQVDREMAIRRNLTDEQMLESIENAIRNNRELFPLLTKYYIGELDGNVQGGGQ